MKQALHIFLKDARRFWPEIAISLAITAAFVRIYPRQWAGTGAELGLVSRLPVIVTVLLPVSWWVLIARVVHAESLVGERQFWITRPYRWQSLVAAKGLYLLACLYLPFASAQILLLKEAGFHPLAHLPGLVFNLVMLTAILVLPLVAIATVTSGFAKMSVALLLIVLYGAGTGYLSTLLPTANASLEAGDQLSFVLLICFVLMVIVLQYATRNTFLSRALLAVLALTFGVLGLFGPEDTAMNMTYSQMSANEHPAVLVAFHPRPAGSRGAVDDADSAKEMELRFPVDISGIAVGTAVKVDAAKVVIYSPTGVRWASHWQGVYLTWLPGEKVAGVDLKVSRAYYDRVKSMPVTLDISVAVTVLKAGAAKRMAVPRGLFSIPGGTICHLGGPGWRDDFGDADVFSCRTAFQHSPLMLVATRFSTVNCSSQAPPNDGDAGYNWFGTLDDSPAEFGLTSVWTDTIYFQRPVYTGSAPEPRQYLCPGSPLGFVPYTIAERRQQHLGADKVYLKDYELKPYIQHLSFTP